MKAMLYTKYGERPSIETVPDPHPTDGGVVVAVKASGICLSDWHGWVGDDPDIELPHVPGHELAGEVVEVGKDVTRWGVGDRVTVPFVGGCGHCDECFSGNHQVCDHQFQPGFTHWGSFAEYVALDFADINLVRLPESLDYVAAASLGCRFVTAFRAIVDQGRLAPGEWVAVHGCGGVGLAAIMIASALGANVIGIDINDDALEMATEMGAIATINGSRDRTPHVVNAVRELTNGGVHLSIDALGHPVTCFHSISNLRKRGRHVQVGLMLGDYQMASVPMPQIIANELEIIGSHGIQAYRYENILPMLASGKLAPEKLVSRRVSLHEAIDILITMDQFKGSGIAVIDQF